MRAGARLGAGPPGSPDARLRKRDRCGGGAAGPWGGAFCDLGRGGQREAWFLLARACGSALASARSLRNWYKTD